MALLVDTFTAALDAVRSAAAAIPAEVGVIKELDRDGLLTSLRALSEIRRILDARTSLVAGEIGYRSRRELGYDGFAQREGFRTPEALIQHETGSTARGALTLVHAGTLVHDALAEREPDSELAHEQSPHEPWLVAVGTAVANGALSVDAASAIRSGLGEPAPDATDATDATGAAGTGTAGGGVTGDDLARAASVLLGEAATLNADRLFKRARELRDELDAAGIANRERTIYQERSVRRVKRVNGLSRYIIDPDLESAAYWDDVYDTLTSPRRGGPRFVNETDTTWADAIARDPRTTGQYVHDALTQLLRMGVDSDAADTHTIIGTHQPAVRVLVTASALAHRTGHGRIEGCDIPVSIETVERVACATGTVAVTFDHTGQPIKSRPRTTPLHPPPTGCPRRPRRRMPLAQLRQVPQLDRSAPHSTLETRPRPDQPCRRTTPLPPPSPPAPQQPLGNPTGGLRLLADPTTGHRPSTGATANANQKRRTARPAA